MKGERYSIDVSDFNVLIHGELSIREAFDFLNYFEKEGYNRLIPGDENSCLHMCKVEKLIKEDLTKNLEARVIDLNIQNQNLKVKIDDLERIIEKFEDAEIFNENE